MKSLFRVARRVFLAVGVLFCLGFAWPQRFVMPVEGAGRSSFHPESFWYHPWGRSVTHKGVDIFARKGTPVRAATSGLVVFTGELGMGGKVALVLGPRWRMHYYAHLERIDVARGHWLRQGERLGTVGDSGNARGKPPHLHYTIGTLVPLPWQVRQGPHGLRRMWYVDPTPLLNGAS